MIIRSTPLKHRLAAIASLAAILVLGSFGAQAKEEFTYQTPELMDKLNESLDTTWPHDPAVPELPPMPVTDNPKMNQDAFLWTHFNDNIYPPRVEGAPERRTRIVTVCAVSGSWTDCGV